MKTYKRIGAAEKTIEFLKYLSNQDHPVKVATIAEAVEMSTSNTMSYLVTLEDIGFARRSDDGWVIGFGASLIRRSIQTQLEIKQREIAHQLNLIDAQNQ